MSKEDIKNYLNIILSWGLGGVLLILGAVLMITHRYLSIEFPFYLIIGSIIMLLGFSVWTITQIINYKLKIKKID